MLTFIFRKKLSDAEQCCLDATKDIEHSLEFISTLELIPDDAEVVRKGLGGAVAALNEARNLIRKAKDDAAS